MFDLCQKIFSSPLAPLRAKSINKTCHLFYACSLPHWGSWGSDLSISPVTRINSYIPSRSAQTEPFPSLLIQIFITEKADWNWVSLFFLAPICSCSLSLCLTDWKRRKCQHYFLFKRGFPRLQLKPESVVLFITVYRCRPDMITSMVMFSYAADTETLQPYVYWFTTALNHAVMQHMLRYMGGVQRNQQSKFNLC